MDNKEIKHEHEHIHPAETHTHQHLHNGEEHEIKRPAGALYIR